MNKKDLLFNTQKTSLNFKGKGELNTTQFRTRRAIILLNHVWQKKLTNLKVLLKEFQKNFEKEKDYEIDRKTLNSLIDDLSTIGLIKNNIFQINYQYKNSIYDERNYKAVFLTY